VGASLGRNVLHASIFDAQLFLKES
jgi:hypothetical protein